MKWQMVIVMLTGAAMVAFPFFFIPTNQTTTGNKAETFSLPALFYGEQNEITHEFLVKNNGAGLIRVEQIITTCTCSEATVENNEILPGGQTSLRLNANIQWRDGLFDAICVLHMSDHTVVSQICGWCSETPTI